MRCGFWDKEFWVKYLNKKSFLFSMKKEEVFSENERLKNIIFEQKRIINFLSNEEIIKGLNNALEDFKNKRYTKIKNY